MAIDLDNKGNGHNPGASIPGGAIPADQIPEKVKAFLGIDSLKGAFTQQQISTALEKLVEAGSEPREFIMRGHYWDRDYKNAWVEMLIDAIHFHDKECEDLLMYTAAGDTSIEGRRIDLLVQSVIGQYNQAKQSPGSKLKSWLGMDKDKNGDK